MRADMKVNKMIPAGLLLVLIGISCILLVNSRWGIGVTHDSIFYLSSAGNLARDHGLQWSGSDGGLHPLTHFPPFYPLIIALFMAFGFPDVRAATWFAAILLGLNLFASGYLVYYFSKSKILPAFTALVLAASVGFVNLHLVALSEPLFIGLMLISIGVLGVYFERPSMKLLLAATLLAASSILTRYIGITVIATGFLSIAALETTPFRTRLKNLLLYAGISLAPILLWGVRNYIMAGSTTNRALIYHSLEWGNRKLGFETITGWFIPGAVSYKSTIAISGLFLAALFFWWLWLGWKLVISRSVNPGKAGAYRIAFMFNLFSLVYLAGILFSLTFFDASTRLDGRILAPVYVAFVCAFFTMVGSLSIRWQAIGVAVSIVIMALSGPTSVRSFSDFLENGIGFSGRDWQSSQAVTYVRDAPQESVIYTNQGMALYFLTQRPVYDIPEQMDVVRNVVRDGYPAQLNLMADRLKMPSSFIVWFAGGGLSDSVLKEAGLDLQAYKEFPDAFILATAENLKNGSLP